MKAEYWKVFFTNVVVFFALLGGVLLAPPTTLTIVELGTLLFTHQPSVADSRATLAAYANYPWASLHFEEFNALETEYQDYYVWRRRDFSGETISIVDGMRTTVNLEGASQKKEVWFFGGSTTWGTGLNDEHTYPSIFAKESGYLSRNFGETGYIATQSLFFLQKELLLSERQDLSGVTVVFLDGINDVEARCRTTTSALGTSREKDIAERLAEKSPDRFSLNATFAQLTQFLMAVRGRVGGDSYKEVIYQRSYDCNVNIDKAKKIAASLLHTWSLAREIVELRGGVFYAFLQPTAHLSEGVADYGPTDEVSSRILGKQYAAVYPLVQAELSKRSDLNLTDMTHIFDNCSDCYIDFAHFGPKGSRILAFEIIDKIVSKKE